MSTEVKIPNPQAPADRKQQGSAGTPCKAEDLKAGSNIRVTTKEGNRNVATCIGALDKNADFAGCCN